LWGCWRRIARGEGEIWPRHATSSAHQLLLEKSEAGKQITVDDFLKSQPTTHLPNTFNDILPSTSMVINAKLNTAEFFQPI
jgi:hypothetical protein